MYLHKCSACGLRHLSRMVRLSSQMRESPRSQDNLDKYTSSVRSMKMMADQKRLGLEPLRGLFFLGLSGQPRQLDFRQRGVERPCEGTRDSAGHQRARHEA